MATLEVRLARSHHTSRLRLRQRLSLQRSEPCASAATREREYMILVRGQGLRIKREFRNFSVGVSLARIEPVGFRVMVGALKAPRVRAQWQHRGSAAGAMSLRVDLQVKVRSTGKKQFQRPKFRMERRHS